jgi:hypothetical protein
MAWPCGFGRRERIAAHAFRKGSPASWHCGCHRLAAAHARTRIEATIIINDALAADAARPDDKGEMVGGLVSGLANMRPAL